MWYEFWLVHWIVCRVITLVFVLRHSTENRSITLINKCNSVVNDFMNDLLLAQATRLLISVASPERGVNRTCSHYCKSGATILCFLLWKIPHEKCALMIGWYVGSTLTSLRLFCRQFWYIVFMICYKRNGKRRSCAYIELWMYLGGLLSTQEVRVALGDADFPFVNKRCHF